MNVIRLPSALVLTSIIALMPSLGCGGSGSDSSATFGTGAGTTTSQGGGAGGASTSSTSAGGAGGASTTSMSASSGGAGGVGGGTTTASSSSTGTGTGTGGASSGSDPNLDGPYTFAEIDASTKVASTGHTVPIHAAFPTAGPSAGPYPVVVVAHGFQLPASQYTSYVKRLASFGYVALTADFPAGFQPDNAANAKDLIGALDWAASAAELAGKADVTKAGMTGHSLGGKAALLAATMDTRVKASITLDPVDSAMNCPAEKCPDVSALMPVAIPTGFLGETTDAKGQFQACAPAADNYATFYANTSSPSLSVTVLGANHMSFLDDVASCGFTCGLCNSASAPNAQVNALARAYVVAFYERWLRGDAGYDTYLTGAEAKARYVDTQQATIESK